MTVRRQGALALCSFVAAAASAEVAGDQRPSHEVSRLLSDLPQNQRRLQLEVRVVSTFENQTNPMEGWMGYPGPGDAGGDAEVIFTGINGPPEGGGSYSLSAAFTDPNGIEGFWGGIVWGANPEDPVVPIDVAGMDTFSFFLDPQNPPGVTFEDADYSLEIFLSDDDDLEGFLYICNVTAEGPCAIVDDGWQRIDIPLSEFEPLGENFDGILTGPVNLIDIAVVTHVPVGVTFLLDNVLFAGPGDPIDPDAPTDPPASAPTDPPVAVPTDPPIAAPTDPPVEMPTDPPLAGPTDPPVTTLPPVTMPPAPMTMPPVPPPPTPTVTTDAPTPPSSIDPDAPTDPPVMGNVTDPPVDVPTDPPVDFPTDPPVATPPPITMPPVPVTMPPVPAPPTPAPVPDDGRIPCPKAYFLECTPSDLNCCHSSITHQTKLIPTYQIKYGDRLMSGEWLCREQYAFGILHTGTVHALRDDGDGRCTVLWTLEDGMVEGDFIEVDEDGNMGLYEVGGGSRPVWRTGCGMGKKSKIIMPVVREEKDDPRIVLLRTFRNNGKIQRDWWVRRDGAEDTRDC